MGKWGELMVCNSEVGSCFVGSFMATARLYSNGSLRACRQLRRTRLLVSAQDLNHRCCLPPRLFAPVIRPFCALNFPSGTPHLHRNLSQEEIELDEEISRLERRHHDAVAQLASSKPRDQRTPTASDVSSGRPDLNRLVSHQELDEETRGLERQHPESGAQMPGSRAREHNKSSLELEGLATVTSHESPSGASRMKRNDRDQASERTPLQNMRLPEALNRNAGVTRKFSSPEVRQVVSVDEEDDGVMGSMLEKDFSSDADLESGTESETDVREPQSCDSGGTAHASHPWDEWNAFLDVLHRKNYFKELPKSSSESEGHLRFQNASYTKNAITEFGRERDDIIRFLTKKHVRMVVKIGCPSTDRKVVNAAKRLRMFCQIPEEEVCQQCKLKTFCTRAFAEPAPKIDAGTVDVVRVLYSFALNASPDAESQVAYPIGVVKSACHLLNEIVQLSAYPRDPGLPKAKSLYSANQFPVVKKATESQDSDRRPGDWTCPDCNFLNFSKNQECRECGTFRENAEQHLEPGDWECPECTFINFRRNKECRECLTPRPKLDQTGCENMEPGDWKCAECQFLNFRKNNECRRCSARRPKSIGLANVEELEPGDWRCPKCNFRNFRRNRECRDCSTLRPVDTEWTSAEPRNDHHWGLKKPLTKSEEGWGSRQSLSTSNTGSAGSRLKYQEWKPDLKRTVNDDTDDDLEEDADIVFSKDDDDTPLMSRGSSSQGNFSNEDSDNEFNFSDVEDEHPQRTSLKKATAKKNIVSKKFDDDDDDDMSDSEDDLSDADQAMSKSTKVGRGHERPFLKWDNISEDEGELSDEKERYGGHSEGRRRLRGKDQVMTNGKLMNDERRKNRLSSGEMRLQGGKEDKKLEVWGRSRTSSFNSDDESDRSTRRGSMRSPRISSDDDRSTWRGSLRGSRTSAVSSNNDRYNRKGSIGASFRDDERGRGGKRADEDTYSKPSMRSPRISSFSSDDERSTRRGTARGSRTSGFSSDNDRSNRKGSIGASFRDTERDRGWRRAEEDTYSKTNSAGRVKAKIRGRQ